MHGSLLYKTLVKIVQVSEQNSYMQDCGARFLDIFSASFVKLARF